MRNRKIIAILMIFFFVVAALTVPGTAKATWTDDWMQQKISSSPSYIEGQKRGYFQGGSFSARWQHSSESAVTVNPPYIKAGCGGIDIFTGGMSFLDFEYLVQKLQKVLQSAAGYAFQIGLKVLCEKCSSALEWITGISDALNGIQLDECKAGKALVAYAAKDMTTNVKAKADMANSLNDFKQSIGYDTLYKRLNEGYAAVDNKADTEKANFDSMISGCSADLQAVFLTEGSLLDNAASRISMAPAHVALVRGLIGDIQIIRTGGPPQANRIPPCEQNGDDPMSAIASGKAYTRSSITAQCTLENDIQGSLRTRIGNLMQGIANNMKNATALDVEQAAFVDTNPLSIQLVLKTAVGTAMEDATISTLTDVTTKAYSYMLLLDLYARANRIIEEMKALKDTGGTGAAHNCDLTVAAEVFEKSSDIPEKLKMWVQRSYDEMMRASADVNTIYNLAEHHRKFDEMARKELQKRFGGAVTMRAMAQ